MSENQRKDNGVEETHYEQPADDPLTPDNWVEGTPEPGKNMGVVSDLTAVPEHVEVKCAGCNNTYGFDIDSRTEGFTFQCTVCKTQTAWTRA